MVCFAVFVESDPRLVSTFPTLRPIPLFTLSTEGPRYPPKSFPLNLSADLHSLNPVAPIFYKNRGWRGHTGRTPIPVRCLGLSPLFATLTQTAGCVSEVPILEFTTPRVCPNRYLSGGRASNVLLEPAGLPAKLSSGHSYVVYDYVGGCDG